MRAGSWGGLGESFFERVAGALILGRDGLGGEPDDWIDFQGPAYKAAGLSRLGVSSVSNYSVAVPSEDATQLFVLGGELLNLSVEPKPASTPAG